MGTSDYITMNVSGPTGEQLQHPERDRTDPRPARTWRFEATASTVRTFQMRAIGVLIVLSTAGQLLIRSFGDVPGLRLGAWLLFVDGEQTVPALYSSIILLCCAALAAVIGWGADPVRDRTGWRALSLVLLAAGFDEYAAIHERAIEPLRDTLAISEGPLYYAWIIPGAVAVVLLAAGFSSFLRRLPGDTRTRFLAGGVLVVLGALGFEALAGGYVSGSIEAVDPGVDPDTARSSLLYVLLTTAEEALEMTGAAVFLTAMVAHLEHHLGRRLSIAVAPPAD